MGRRAIITFIISHSTQGTGTIATVVAIQYDWKAFNYSEQEDL